jgi:hypothetical protein
VHAAATNATTDSDGDGLADELELKLGTAIDCTDTDGDGFSDAEEIARGSFPTRANSVPHPGVVKLNIAAYQCGDQIHALTAIYLGDGDMHSRTFTVGLLEGNTPTPKPLHSFRGTNPIVVLPGSTPGSKVVLVDPVLPTNGIQQIGSLSFYATLAEQGHYVAGDALNLTVVDGEIFEHVFIGYHTGDPDPEPNVGMGVGGVYQPLGAGLPPPNTATMGEICAQTTIIVGMTGAVITEEVVAADCVPGWNAYCSRGCGHTVGSTIKIIDPATLLGG